MKLQKSRAVMAPEASESKPATHRQMKKLLAPFLDGELPPEWQQQVQAHLQTCAPCRQIVEQMRASIQLVRASNVPPAVDSHRLWQQIIRQTAQERMRWFDKNLAFDFASHNLLRWAGALAVAVLFVAVIWRRPQPAAITYERALPESASNFVFDYGLFMDALEQLSNEYDFYERYQAQVVNLEQLASRAPFRLAAYQSLPHSYRLQTVRLLRNACCQSVLMRYLKNGKPVAIFQQSRGHPWTFGRHPLIRANYAGRECLQVDGRKFCALSWQGEDCEFIVVGQLSAQEIEPLLLALR